MDRWRMTTEESQRVYVREIQDDKGRWKPHPDREDGRGVFRFAGRTGTCKCGGEVALAAGTDSSASGRLCCCLKCGAER